jgi:glutathione S-transferase
MLTLYFTPGSSSMAPHIALHEIGVPFESRPISLAKKENRAASFLAVNPEGKVPALLIDGRLLTEVAGILPVGDIEAEAQAVSWMSFIAATVHPARARGLDYATTIYKLADQRLGNREWAVGRYSIADIHLFRLFWRFSNSLKPPAGSFPNLEAHHARMMARAAVQRTIAIESSIGYDLP